MQSRFGLCSSWAEVQNLAVRFTISVAYEFRASFSTNLCHMKPTSRGITTKQFVVLRHRLASAKKGKIDMSLNTLHFATKAEPLKKSEKDSFCSLVLALTAIVSLSRASFDRFSCHLNEVFFCLIHRYILIQFVLIFLEDTTCTLHLFVGFSLLVVTWALHNYLCKHYLLVFVILFFKFYL